MNRKTYKTVSKFTSVLLSVATVGLLSGGSLIMPLTASADTTSDTIAQLQAQIAALTAQLSSLAGSSKASAGACGFTRSLSVGAKGDDVTCLQNYLQSTGHFNFAGGATGYFGNVTKNAVAAWQAANGVAPAVGYFGSLSRAKYSSTVSVSPTPAPTPNPTPGTPAPVPAASGTLRVDAGTQPNSSLFPTNATRVPFTVVKFTAPADKDITVNSVVVERDGLANDAAFAGVVLLDEQGIQLGVAKTLNSTHQATLSEPFTVKAGQTRTMTLAGNAQTSNGGYGGQVAYLSLVSVNSNAASVAGSLPVSGAGHTVNETLTIGSVTLLRGATDPGSSQTENVGQIGYVFSAVKVTAGSAEKVYLRSIRWNQTGSAASGDLANIKTYVEGTAYDTIVSSDGKYYTATFGDNSGKGILIDKGFSKEISIKGDVVGGSGRNIAFDLAKRTDIGLVGENFGYGITPPQTGVAAGTDASSFTSSEDPWYDASVVTVSAGTMNVSTSNTAPAQNIAVNLSNQPFGSFQSDVKGEAISVSRIGFNVTLGSEPAAGDVDDLTNVTLVDENGAVVAGPVDGSATDSSNTTGSGDGSIVFTDTVTFPVGVHTYTLKGKVGTDLTNNVTIQASTTPSTDFGGTVRGLITGNTITPAPTSAITFNTMTVKTGNLTVSASSVPIAQTVISNAKGFTFANYILDATASGEDVRLTTLPVVYGVANGSASDLTNCQMWDGSASVTTGSNTKNPTSQSSSTSFTFDGTGLVIPKGSSKTLALKCDVAGGATGAYIWGLDTDQASSFTGATGLTSGQTITETLNESNGQLMTASSGGSLAATLDAQSAGYKVVNAGATGVELSRIRFSASNEDINLKQVALQITGTASSTGVGSTTPVDLVGRSVTLWDADTMQQVGSAVFPTNAFATSSAITNFKIPRDGAKTLIVKGDIAAISNSGPLTSSGDLLIVDYDGGNTGLNGTYGTGVSSGTTISPTGADTVSSGVRIMKAYPTLTYIPLTSSDRTLTPGTTADKTLYRFSVTANGGDIALYKLTFQVSSTSMTATTSLFSLYAYTDSAMSSADTGFSSNGLLNNGQDFCAGAMANAAGNNTVGNASPGVQNQNTPGLCGTAAGRINGSQFPLNIFMEKLQATVHSATTTYVVPSGTTRYFRLAATVANVENVTGQESFTVQLQGDAAFARPAHLGGTAGNTTIGEENRTGNMFNASTTNRDNNNSFIWSPRSTSTTSAFQDVDFTNGYLLPGLPTNNMPIETFTSPN